MERLNTAQFEPVNLDGLGNGSENFAEASDYFREAGEVFALYSRYCKHKSEAAEFRLGGEISAARTVENFANEIYLRLPEWARW